MKATAIALLLVPVMSSYRGYFQGMQEMRPTAISEIAEQSFRVLFGLVLAYSLMVNEYSIASGYTPEQRGAAGGCFGASAGAIGGLAVMLIVYMAAKKKIKLRIKNDKTSVYETAGTILKKIAVIAYSLKTSVFYADQLRGLFGSGVEVASYALEKGINAPIQADVALISVHSIYGYVEEKLAQCQYLMIADLTLYQEAVGPAAGAAPRQSSHAGQLHHGDGGGDPFG